MSQQCKACGEPFEADPTAIYCAKCLDEAAVITGFIGKSGNYCPVYQKWINDELVNIIKPSCIKENNGCGNCPSREHRFESVPITKVIENE